MLREENSVFARGHGSLFAIARPASGDNVIARIAAPARQWKQMIAGGENFPAWIFQASMAPVTKAVLTADDSAEFLRGVTAWRFKLTLFSSLACALLSFFGATTATKENSLARC